MGWNAPNELAANRGRRNGWNMEVSKQEFADFPGNPWLKHGVATERVQEFEDERILTIRKYACKDRT